MIVAFKDRNLRDLCEDEDKCILEYGQKATIQLQNRLSDLLAAESLSDIIAGNLKEIRLEDSIGFQLELDENHILQLISNHVTSSDFNSGDTIDKSIINRVKITAINKKVL